MEKEELSRSYTNTSHKSYNESYTQERKMSILERTLSLLGDISSRGIGGGVATNTASPIVARREKAEVRLSVRRT